MALLPKIFMIYKPLTSTAILDDCVKFNGKSVVGCFLTCLGFLFYIVKKFFVHGLRIKTLNYLSLQ